MNMNFDEGMVMIKKVVEFCLDDGYIVDLFGWVYYCMGKYEDVVCEFQCVVQLKEGDVIINDYYGDVLWCVGCKLEVIFQWNCVLVVKLELDLEVKIRVKLKDGLFDFNGKMSVEVDVEKVMQMFVVDVFGKKF